LWITIRLKIINKVDYRMDNTLFEKRMGKIDDAIKMIHAAIEIEKKGIEYGVEKATSNHDESQLDRLESLLLNIAENYGIKNEVKKVLKK